MTIEDVLAMNDGVEEEMEKLTPENHPYFYSVFGSEDIQFGARVAACHSISISKAAAYNAVSEVEQYANRQAVDRPDLIAAAYSTGTMGETRWVVAETHFFVGQSGALCFRADAQNWALVEVVSPAVDEKTKREEFLPFPFARVRDAVAHRNQEWSVSPPKELRELLEQPTIEAPRGEHLYVPVIPDGLEIGLRQVNPLPALHSMSVWTGQETDVYVRSAADGSRGINWRNEERRDVRVWEAKDATHRVELARKTSPDDSPISWEKLQQLTGDQNADFALALFYVASCLSPSPDNPGARLLTGIIDLNDVMAKIGWLAQKPDKAKKNELRQKLWRFLVFGEEAVLVGDRSIVYRDPITKEEISTRMESAAWKIIDQGRPKDDPTGAPLWAEIVIGRQWEGIFSDARLAQFMPLGELLGGIPPHKVAGDWARVIGLTLAKIWRCHTHKTVVGELQITRHDLLTHFTPKTQTVEELLASKDPKRAVQYYRDALNILLPLGLIAREGDAAKEMDATEMLKRYGGRQGWQRDWLYDSSGLVPADKWRQRIEELAGRTFASKPRDLKALPKRPSKRRL